MRSRHQQDIDRSWRNTYLSGIHDLPHRVRSGTAQELRQRRPGKSRRWRNPARDGIFKQLLRLRAALAWSRPRRRQSEIRSRHDPRLPAAECSHTDCARLLIDYGADDLKIYSDLCSTPVGWRLNTAKSTARSSFSRTAPTSMTHRSTAQFRSSWRLLGTALSTARGSWIQTGADVDKASSGDDSTPLRVASSNNRVDYERLLIEYGADVNKASTDKGRTRLLVAQHYGRVDSSRLVIEKGAFVAKSRSSQTRVRLTMSRNGSTRCTRLLVEKGADVGKARTSDDVTPLPVSSQNGHGRSFSPEWFQCQQPQTRLDSAPCGDSWWPRRLCADRIRTASMSIWRRRCLVILRSQWRLGMAKSKVCSS